MPEELAGEFEQEGAAIRESRIDLVTGILIMLSMIVLDLLELVPFVGDFTSILAFGVNFYLKQIGVSGVLFLVSNALDFIPVVQEFPCKSIGWALTWGIEALGPKNVVELAEKAGEASQGKVGGVGAAAGTAESAARTAGRTVEEASRVEAAKEKMSEAAGAAGGIRGEKGKDTMGGEDERGEEEDERVARERELESLMRTGAEISPEEEALEASFSPKETQFHEARSI